MKKTRIQYEYTKELQKEGEGCIYKITNLVNGKVYIGQTVNFKNRMYHYKSTLAKGQTKLHRAFKKYGFDNFKSEILCFGKLGEELDILEIFNIASYYSVKKGYNCEYGGNSGYIMSEETKAKISNSTIGRKKSIEHRNNISKSHIGVKPSNESKEKNRKWHLGKIGPNKGKKFTEEHIKNMSESRKGKITSEETKKKLSEALKGRKFSKEHRDKISKSKSKSVVQYTLDGIFIREFTSIKEAANATGTFKSLICKCLKGIRRSTGEFKWKYKVEV